MNILSPPESRTDDRSPGRLVRLFICGLLAVVAGLSCRPSQLRLGPDDRLERLEGYALLKVSDGRARAKTKFSFCLELPDKGRIDVFDVLGRALFVLISRDEEAYFAAVSQKAFWRGGRDDLLNKFLGFDLSLDEMAGLLSGRWGREPGGEEAAFFGWTLTRDAKGRVTAAENRDVRIEVKDFFPGTTRPHTVLFRSGERSGSIKVYDLKFNAPSKEGPFRLTFLDGFESKTWEEMERLLADETPVVR
jgi:hypothetical protein